MTDMQALDGRLGTESGYLSQAVSPGSRSPMPMAELDKLVEAVVGGQEQSSRLHKKIVQKSGRECAEE
jgi:hypothetical protein